MEHLSRERLVAGLGHIRDSPKDGGRLVLVIRRPAVGARELPVAAVLNQVAGLAGDNWLARGSTSTPDGSADPARQVTVMNARVAELVAGGTDRMPLAGDQLYIDLDLSQDNLPAGSLLAVGQAVLQVSGVPHLGCAKFVERFGAEAMRFVNSRVGRQLRLRGMNTRVVVPGAVRVGDLAAKVPLHDAASPSFFRYLPPHGAVGWNGCVDEELRRELLARRDEDQRIRGLVSPQGQQMARLPDEVAAEWQRVDEGNTRWLGDVLATRGWPRRTLVSEDGAQAAWLLAQHADRDPVRQRLFLDALRGAVADGEASPAHLAYLEDRVRVHAGQPQLYGTQFTITDGQFGPCPIEDPQRLDERRAEAGLEPFAAYEARMQAQS